MASAGASYGGDCRCYQGDEMTRLELINAALTGFGMAIVVMPGRDDDKFADAVLELLERTRGII